jgi:hypothetical protein
MAAKKAAKRLKKAKKRDQAVEESAEAMGSPRRGASGHTPECPNPPPEFTEGCGLTGVALFVIQASGHLVHYSGGC